MDIEAEGIRNIRDPGGIVNKEGKTIRPKCFIRSAELSTMTDLDERLLAGEFRLSTVIDLRTDREITERPDIIPAGVEYHHLPLYEESALGITWEKGLRMRRMLAKLPDLGELYKHMLTDERSLEHFRAVFRLIIEHEPGSALLWHCTEGKDRCGITAALVLTLLDVDREIIFDDYLKSNITARKKAKKFFFLVLAFAGGFKKAKQVEKLFLAEREYLQAAFDAIDEVHGGADSFFRNKLQISDEERKQFKERFLMQ